MTTSKTAHFMLLIALASPLIAEGRAGSSYGGSNSYRGAPSSSFGGSYHSQPSRPYTPPAYTNPSPYQQAPAPYAAPQRSSGFLPGLFSGAAGAYLYNKVFNNNAQATTTTPQTDNTQPYNKSTVTTTTTPAPAQKSGGGFLRTILLLLIAYFAWRYFKKRRQRQQQQNQFSQDAPTQDKGISDYINQVGSQIGLGTGATTTPNVANVSDTDLNAFQQLLQNIQSAWSNYDIARLRESTTPEMLASFSKTIESNQSRGIRNIILNVQPVKVNVQTAWQDGSDQYAQVEMTWSAIDYAVNTSVPENSPGHLIDGNMNQPTMNTEIWTFKKEGSGPWLLAAISE